MSLCRGWCIEHIREGEDSQWYGVNLHLNNNFTHIWADKPSFLIESTEVTTLIYEDYLTEGRGWQIGDNNVNWWIPATIILNLEVWHNNWWCMGDKGIKTHQETSLIERRKTGGIYSQCINCWLGECRWKYHILARGIGWDGTTSTGTGIGFTFRRYMWQTGNMVAWSRRSTSRLLCWYKDAFLLITTLLVNRILRGFLKLFCSMF